eukprot:1974014-Heterocapsa_arctica.AAC.1
MIYDPAQMAMSNDVCEPARLPRHNDRNFDTWMNFSRALSTILRHTGSGLRDGHARIADEAGWATIAQVFVAAAAWRKRPALSPDLCINHLLGIVLDDDKGRFQLAVLVAVPAE